MFIRAPLPAGTPAAGEEAMRLVEILIHGWFANAEDPAAPVSLDIKGDHIAGFYATRVIEVADDEAAMERAKAFLRRELSCLMLNRPPGVVINFDVEDVCEVDAADADMASRGFTFY